MKKKSNSYFLLGSPLAKHGLKVDNDVKFEEKMILKCPENYKNLESIQYFIQQSTFLTKNL